MNSVAPLLQLRATHRTMSHSTSLPNEDSPSFVPPQTKAGSPEDNETDDEGLIKRPGRKQIERRDDVDEEVDPVVTLSREEMAKLERKVATPKRQQH